jgi:large subunit ribosomal protein L23
MKQLHIYDVIRRPVISEKATRISEQLGQVTFEVAPNANKVQIREAVEYIFDVEVARVNTLIMPAKRGRRGRRWYVRSQQWKKAIITLKAGYSIKLFDV